MQCRAIPYEGKDPYLFINYCHKDSAILYPVFEQMVRDGYRIWFDDGNQAGDDWLDNIENHLEECNAVIAFLSGNSSMSHSCKSEIVYAFKCRKKIIPVLIDNTVLPKGLRTQMSHLQCLSAYDYGTLPELLEKIYVCPECKACYSDDGSLMLREIPKNEKAEPLVTEESPQEILSKLTPVRVPVRRKKVPVVIKDIKVPSPVSDNTDQTNPQSEDASANVEPAKADKTNKSRKVVHIQAQIKKVEHPLPVHNSDNRQEDPLPNESVAHSVPELVSEHSELPKQDEMIAEVQTPEEPQNNDAATGLSSSIFETIGISSDICMLEETEYQNSNESEVPDDSEEGATIRMESRNLALLLHPASQRAYILRKPQAKIGRSPIKCDIVIEGNDSISKYHADIIQYQKKIFLRDMNSVNGTYINDTPIESGSQVPLSNPAIFQLSDETLILLSGALARQYVNMKRVSLLMNGKGTAVCMMDVDDIPLNRSNPWPDGTLSDTMIHRASHARIRLENDGYHLVNEAPAKGNGTYLNEKRMKYQESRLLNPGDKIRIGETVLEFVSISI